MVPHFGEKQLDQEKNEAIGIAPKHNNTKVASTLFHVQYRSTSVAVHQSDFPGGRGGGHS